ncbi:MAG: ABC transporter ATP-binding protein [Burkholderiaceae bacterium]
MSSDDAGSRPATGAIGAIDLPGPAEPAPDAAIEVAGLSKFYPIFERPAHRLLQMLWRGRRRYYREFHALEDVSFSVRRGATLGIVGRNGAGKSTLLQLICGTLTPSAGRVRVNGRVAALLELGAGFNPEFTGRENVVINAAILGLTPAEVDARLDAIFAFADIGEFVDQPVKTYSSGMYVRLAFSVAIHVSPDILVVDEALSVGDAFFQAKCMARIRRMLDDGVTLLFISHDIAAVKAICSEVLWLDRGRVRAHGATEQVAALYTQDWVAQANAALGGPAEAAPGAAAPDGPRDRPTHLATIPEDFPARSGDGRARFAAAGWRVPSGPAQHVLVEWGDALTIDAELEVRVPCERLVVSYHVKDRHQQHLVGGHTHDDPRVYGRAWAAGERLRVRFTLPVRLREGAYTLTLLAASIGDLARYADAVFLDWIDDVALMRVAARGRFPLSDLLELEHEVVVDVVQAGGTPDPGAR